MGKWCLQAGSFIVYQIFIKLADNQDRHKILDEFELWPDRISHFGVTCLLRVNLIFSRLIMESPSSVDLSDENILGTLWRNSSYSFPPIVLKFFRCFLHGMKMCMWFGYNSLIIFSQFFCFVNLVFFLYETLSKCIDSGYLLGTNPYSLLQLF